MKSIVEVEIDKPQIQVAALFADPRNNPKWMHDLARCERISGDLGKVGSTYRLVPKEGDMIFIATVAERRLPDKVRIDLKGATVDVAITGTFIPLSSTRTKLISEEVFSFKDSDGVAAESTRQNAIRRVHEQHIEDFRIFAEND